MSLAVFGTPVTYSGAVGLESVSTFSVTVPSGCTKLVVSVGWIRNPAQTISSVTYGGVAMTSRVSQIDTIDGVLANQQFTLDTPTVGAANVIVTFSGLVRTGSIAFFLQASATGAPAHTATAGDAYTKSVTSATGNLVTDLQVTNQGDSITLAASAGQTVVSTVIGAIGAGGNSVRLSVSWKAGAASVTTTWTPTGGPADYKILTQMDFAPIAGGTGAVTGTGGSGMTGPDIRSGGKTLIVTLTGDTFVASGATFDAQRQAILNGIVSASSPTWGWNTELPNIPVTAVVRTSSTVCTVTLPALAGYQSDTTETLTWTVPAAAVVLAVAIVATPTVAITRTSTDLTPVGAYSMSGTAVRNNAPTPGTGILQSITLQRIGNS